MTLQNFKAGGGVTDTPANVKCFRSSPGASNYDTLELAAVNYQVPAGKTLYITKIIIHSDTAVGKFVLSYADTAVDNSATPGTNDTPLTAELQAATANTPYTHDVCIAIPTGKYPCIRATAAVGGKITLLGIEV